MVTKYFEGFISKLREIFMMDETELDFGIYRIMNQKRDEINDFLSHKLLPQVEAILSENSTEDTSAIKNRLKEIETNLGTSDVDSLDVKNVPIFASMVNEYHQLKKKLANTSDAQEMENDVFSHLTTFFSRYYDGGDFISQRRYKDNTYAIPYNGEEVKLYWANADQYYIKTSEYFRNYTFVLPGSKKKVNFVLLDANTELNNNKLDDKHEHRFVLYNPEEHQDREEKNIIEVNEVGNLNIYFTYEVLPKSKKQADLSKNALKTISVLIPEGFEELLSVELPTKANPHRTLLEKQLTDYTSKNSFDYFIHKNLGKFLNLELDYYLKNEVLHIDDLDANHITSQLTKVKAIKLVGQKIIEILAQLENFQKKLWLKKKFVVQCDYCITLDRIPEELYPEIIANDAQREEWVKLFAIDEIKEGDIFKSSYSKPLTENFLKENPNLVLDTSLFSFKFKQRLLSSIEDIDNQSNGLIINSENFQALQLLQRKYSSSIKCIYLDPPYNTGTDNDFAYKDDFQHSSWAAMMNNRARLAYNLMNNKATFWVSTDDGEYANLKLNLDSIFGENNFLFDIIWNSRKSVSNDALVSVATNHTSLFAKNKEVIKSNKVEFRIDANEEGFDNPDNDPKGPWKSDPMDAPRIRENLSYGITNPNTNETFYPSEGRHWRFEEKDIAPLMKEGRILFGKNGKSRPSYKRYKFEAMDKGDTVTTLWDDVKTTADGTKMLINLFGNKLPKEFIDNIKPKPVEFIDKIINLSTTENDIIMDYFCGSATTAHAVINSCRKDKNNKYILCDMNYYFDFLTKSRIEKVIYSNNWKSGKPLDNKGISHCFKYIRLEQYEDTLNNLEIKDNTGFNFNDNDKFHESYMLRYMLDTETKDSLFNLKWFENPFAMTIKTTKDNELVDTKVDMVETFNYLIGLNVKTIDWFKDDNICVVEGTTHKDGYKTLVIWRNCKVINNEELNKFFDKMDYRVTDSEYDLIYVNGDNTLPNLRRDDEHWKVILTEEEFAKRMFEDC